YGFRSKDFEESFLAIVCKRSCNTITIFEQTDNGILLIDFNTLMNTMILQCTDHLQACAITHMREARIFMPTEIALKNSSVWCSVEHSTPRFKLTHMIRRLLHKNFNHAPVVEVLTTTHRVCKM